MKTLFRLTRIIVILLAVSGCAWKGESYSDVPIPDRSGVYCLDWYNLVLILEQSGEHLEYRMEPDRIPGGEGTLDQATMLLSSTESLRRSFSATLEFSADGRNFSGNFQFIDQNGERSSGSLSGSAGRCLSYDIDGNGIPRFVDTDFTQLDQIASISRFRSAIGHSYQDDFESCRSMKHYYRPYDIYRENGVVAIHSPVKGMILDIRDEGHGASTDLTNKQIHIQPEDQPAFTIIIFHADLIDDSFISGRHVTAGEQLAFARMYYEDLNEHATNFDIAVRVNTPSGSRLVSYIDILSDEIFNTYLARGASSRQDFIISQEARDADPLQCDGERFLVPGTLDDWFTFPGNPG